MPIYEYVCDSCHHGFERLQSFSDGPVTACPDCGQATVRRVISPVGVIFKGSGWYVTDSKRQLKTARAGGADAATAESGSGAEGRAPDGGGGKDEGGAGGEGGPASGAEQSAGASR
jgi:putative FmdB family regulatory protein